MALGVKSSTLSVWLANNRQLLSPYRRSAHAKGYLYYAKAVCVLHGINRRGVGRLKAWKALRPPYPRIPLKK